MKPIQTYYNGYHFRSRLEARWAVFFDALKVKYEYEPEGFNLGNGILYLPDFYLPEYRCYFEVKRSGILENGCFNKDWIETSEDGKKVLAFTENLKVHNTGDSDYLLFASGDPYDCIIDAKPDCGIVFNGMAAIIDYSEDTPKATAYNEMFLHMPVTFDYVDFVYNNGTKAVEKLVVGKRDYSDFDKSGGKREIVPCGKNCFSMFAAQKFVLPRYRGEPIVDLEGLEYMALMIPNAPGSLLLKACEAARQARFEHGERPAF